MNLKYSDERLAVTEPCVKPEKWQDWRWQLANRLKTPEELADYLGVSLWDSVSCEARRIFPMSVPPYYASLIDGKNPQDPLLMQVLPVRAELEHRDDELDDPLAEDRYMPVPSLTHRYPDRALLYTTHHCAVYCRHCNRRRKVGDPGSAPSRDEQQAAIDYIAATKSIRDVLVSGGDPLSLSDTRLGALLGALHAIEHLEIIRIATRCPVTLPQRITPDLVHMLRLYHPIYVNTHFNHIRECTNEAAQALTLLADAGCVVGNQMVLLKGVNDDAPMVRRMNQWLLKHRCRPYYIFQCDSTEGVGHFKTPVESGLAIIESLRGWTSGMAVPHYVVDLPKGGGKVPLQPQYLQEHVDQQLEFRNYAGEPFSYQEGS